MQNRVPTDVISAAAGEVRYKRVLMLLPVELLFYFFYC
jgi:hypothetical protein